MNARQVKMIKADKEMLRHEFEKVWRKRDGSIDQKMVDYCVKKTSAYIVVDRCIVTFDKPDIETRFCFGYGIQGGYDYDEAGRAADYAAKSLDYFVGENLSRTTYDRLMRYIQDDCFPFEPWLDRQHYTNQDADCRLGAIRWERWDKRAWCEQQGWRKLTNGEVTRLYLVCYDEQVKFLKRLKTYLKRHGLNMVQTWTYWADE